MKSTIIFLPSYYYNRICDFGASKLFFHLILVILAFCFCFSIHNIVFSSITNCDRSDPKRSGGKQFVIVEKQDCWWKNKNKTPKSAKFDEKTCFEAPKSQISTNDSDLMNSQIFMRIWCKNLNTGFQAIKYSKLAASCQRNLTNVMIVIEKNEILILW